MAFMLSNLKPSSLLPQTKSNFRYKQITFSSAIPSSSSLAQVAQVNTPTLTTGSHEDKHQQQKDEFYLNLGLAVRTLREDMPLIFIKDLNYDISGSRTVVALRSLLRTFATHGQIHRAHVTG